MNQSIFQMEVVCRFLKADNPVYLYTNEIPLSQRAYMPVYSIFIFSKHLRHTRSIFTKRDSRQNGIDTF